MRVSVGIDREVPMWKKQEETKPKAASPQAGPSTIVAPRPEAVASAPAAPFAPAAQAAQASSPAFAAPPVAASRSSMPSPGGMGRLSKSLMIKGEISGREDLFIDCEVQGKIR